MGVYLYADGADEVKVSGLLTRVIPVASSACGSLPAEEFLSLLSKVEREFRSSCQWSALVEFGVKDALDAQASSSGVAGVPGDAFVSAWFDDRKLATARRIGEHARASSLPVLWG